MSPFTLYLSKLFRSSQNPAQSEGMEAYLKNQFPFFGVKAPERRHLQKLCLKKHPIENADQLEIILYELWEKEEREFQYCGADLAAAYFKLLTQSQLACIKNLISHKSWWDTVDSLATQTLGLGAKKYPDWKAQMTHWAQDENLWIRRSALLYQLKYGKDTHVQELFSFCSQMASEKEFFIAKAIGWALRQYSRTNYTAVQKFVDTTPLQALSRREALRLYITK